MFRTTHGNRLAWFRSRKNEPGCWVSNSNSNSNKNGRSEEIISRAWQLDFIARWRHFDQYNRYILNKTALKCARNHANLFRHREDVKSNSFLAYPVDKKGKGFPILDTERWARSWSRCTGSQPAGVIHPAVGCHYFPTNLQLTSPAAEHHRPLAGTKLYCLVTEAHRCEQLAQGCYAALPRAGFGPATYWSQAQMPYRCTTASASPYFQQSCHRWPRMNEPLQDGFRAYPSTGSFFRWKY